MAMAAWAENMTSTLSSSSLNFLSSRSWPRKTTPTVWPRCRMGADMPAHTGMGSAPFELRPRTPVSP